MAILISSKGWINWIPPIWKKEKKRKEKEQNKFAALLYSSPEVISILVLCLILPTFSNVCLNSYIAVDVMI